MDREKVIKGLEHCTAWAGLHECQPKFGPDCPYEDDADCKLALMRDALTILKEQEAVKPLREHSGGGTTWWNVCGACRTAINPNDKYCHECGRPVKWNG